MKHRFILAMAVLCASLLPIASCSDKSSNEACLHETTSNLDKGNYAAVAQSPCADHLQKGAAYFGLAGIAFVALCAARAKPWSRMLWPALGLVLLGGVLEIIQGYVGRDMSIWDEAANTLGVGAGGLAGWAYVSLFAARRLVEAGPPD